MSAARPLEGVKAPWGGSADTQWQTWGPKVVAAGPLEGVRAPWGAAIPRSELRGGMS